MIYAKKKFRSLFILGIITVFSCSSDDEQEAITEVVIETSDFETTIEENPEAGYALGTVEASTNTGTIVFDFVEQTPEGAFDIEIGSGELTVADETLFEYDINPVLNAVVSATNGNVVEHVSVTVNLTPSLPVIEGVIWQKTLYTTGNYQEAKEIVANLDGSYTIGGKKTFYGSPDWHSRISKIDANGDLIWEEDIGNLTDFSSLEPTLSNGYIVGATQTVNDQYITSYRIYKYDGNGNEQWHKTIGGSLHDNLSEAKLIDDGGYILGGFSSSNISGDKDEDSNGGLDYWVVKVDSSGDIEWQNSIGGSSWDALRSISPTMDGGYLLAGESSSNISGDKTEDSRGGLDYWIIKLDETGEIQWQKTIGGESDEALRSVVVTSDGGAVVAGFTDSGIGGDKTENSNGLTDIWIVKLSANGNIEWQNTIGGSDEDEVNSINQTFDNGFILAGTSKSNATGDKTEDSQGGFDYWLIKLNSAGNIEWQDTMGGDNDDVLNDVKEDNNENFILAGSSSSGISGDKTVDGPTIDHYWIIKYSIE